MLRWMCGHTRKDRVQNDDIRGRVGVAPIEEKLVQKATCSTVRCGGDAYVEMDVWPHEEVLSTE